MEAITNTFSSVSGTDYYTQTVTTLTEKECEKEIIKLSVKLSKLKWYQSFKIIENIIYYARTLEEIRKRKKIENKEYLLKKYYKQI